MTNTKKIVVSSILTFTTLLLILPLFISKYTIYNIVFKLRNDTGSFYIKENNKVIIQTYKNGLRDGAWLVYDEKGNVIVRAEYKNDRPWDGICFWKNGDMFWLCEYKNGVPWNGHLPRKFGDMVYSNDTWGYYIDGQEVGYEAFCSYYGYKGTKEDRFFCLMHIGDKKLTPLIPKGFMDRLQGIQHHNSHSFDSGR